MEPTERDGPRAAWQPDAVGHLGDRADLGELGLVAGDEEDALVRASVHGQRQVHVGENDGVVKRYESQCLQSFTFARGLRKVSIEGGKTAARDAETRNLRGRCYGIVVRASPPVPPPGASSEAPRGAGWRPSPRSARSRGRGSPPSASGRAGGPVALGAGSSSSFSTRFTPGTDRARRWSSRTSSGLFTRPLSRTTPSSSLSLTEPFGA